MFGKKVKLILLAIKELGIHKIFLNALYRIGLKTGYWAKRTPFKPESQHILKHRQLPYPEKEAIKAISGFDRPALVKEANEILNNSIRLFGNPPSSLNFTNFQSAPHWSLTDDHKPGGEDIKFEWEPARFGWAYILARVYYLSGEERYAKCFWDLFDTFVDMNPINQGENWASAQEAALRIFAMSFCFSIFEPAYASTPERKSRLLNAIGDHADRICPTLIYARSQNNNHLLTEAAGLYTAGIFLTNHPHRDEWLRLGKKWINYCFEEQIAPDGTYVQQSMNYHRLVIQTALWINQLEKNAPQSCLTDHSRVKLHKATQWMIAQLDQISGMTPNLGHNDGALIMPLSNSDFQDYRPICQAASLAFLNQPCLPTGPWNEMAFWFGLENQTEDRSFNKFITAEGVHKIGNAKSWGTLRAVEYSDRPAHADQLHVELWWNGLNIAQDAGTYRYTAPQPWGNRLSSTEYHNTVIVDGQDQMIRAGRFLWLDWAQAQITSSQKSRSISAKHNGYQKIGVSHTRKLQVITENEWNVTDLLTPKLQNNKNHQYIIHWLLIDGSWLFNQDQLSIDTTHGKIFINVKTENVRGSAIPKKHEIIRAGQSLLNETPNLETFGWIARTYGEKKPAISFRVCFESKEAVKVTTKFIMKPA